MVDERLSVCLPIIRERFGDIEALEPLVEGQSGSFVARIRFCETSYILKLTKNVREYTFYTQVAPQFLSQGIAVPYVADAGWDTTGGWLLLEDISRPVPRSRWLADPELLAMLRRLHSLTPVHPIPHSFEPCWTLEMTEAFGLRLPECFMPMLHALRERHSMLFQKQCVISGDPNPTNWGLRADGLLVLFDWERVGYGTPAIDLAITVPGLGTMDDYRRVARTYLGAPPDSTPGEVEQLAHGITIAKVWTVIEYVASAAESETHVDRAAALLDVLPSWLQERFAEDEEFHRAAEAGNA